MVRKKDQALRITHEESYDQFREMAQVEGYGGGSPLKTYWDFVRVLMEFYTQNQQATNLIDLFDLKIRELKIVGPSQIKELLREVLRTDGAAMFEVILKQQLEALEAIEGEEDRT